MANYMVIFLLNSHYSATQTLKYIKSRSDLDLKNMFDPMKEMDESLKLILSSKNMELEELFSAIAVPCNHFLFHCFISSKEAEMGKEMPCCHFVRTF